MPTYTVEVAYYEAFYAQEITVRAGSPAEACELAVELADDE